MKESLFPEMDREIQNDRLAAKREEVQRARDYLKGRDLTWLINHLLENGPKTEHALMLEVMDEEFHFKDASRQGMNVLCDVWALWLVKKLWRRSQGIHPGSGEESYLYGVRNVHPNSDNSVNSVQTS